MDIDSIVHGVFCVEWSEHVGIIRWFQLVWLGGSLDQDSGCCKSSNYNIVSYYNTHNGVYCIQIILCHLWHLLTIEALHWKYCQPVPCMHVCHKCFDADCWATEKASGP